MTITALTIAEEASALRTLKQDASTLEQEAKEMKAAALEAELKLHARMEEEGIESIKYDGTLFVPVETNYGQVQDRAEFVAWAQENSPELLEHKERKALVNELVRERLDSGEELPPGLGFYCKQYISQRSG